MAKDQIDDFDVENVDDKDLDQYGVWVSTDSQDEDADPADASLLDLDEGNESVDDLGDLNDLLMSIDEEGDQDDTIYLEEEDMSLDLDDDTSDLLLDQDQDGSGSMDDLEGFSIPSLDGDEIDLSDDTDDFTIPELDDGMDEKNLLGEEMTAQVNDLAGSDDDFSIDLDTPDDLGLPEEEILGNLDEQDEDTEGLPDVPNLVEESLEGPELEEPSMDLVLEASDTDQGLDDLDIDMDIGGHDDDLVIEDNFSDLGDQEDLEIDLGSDDDLVLEEPESFDDIGAVTSEMFGDTQAETVEQTMDEMEMTFEEPKAHPSPAPESSEGTTAGTAVLTSIEKELHAIRSELMDLRSELARFRTKAAMEASGQVPTIDQLVEESNESLEMDGPGGGDIGETSPKGFFEDDEDETIALTGDELDNILNSAEFTEEEGEPTMIDEGVDNLGEIEIGGVDDELALDSMSREEGPESDSVENASVPSPVYEDQSLGNVPPIEEIVLEEIESQDHALDFDDEVIIDDVGPTAMDSMNAADTDEVEQMASLDIESELAGIEDLSDGDHDIDLVSETDLDSIELDVPADMLDQDSDLDLDEALPEMGAPISDPGIDEEPSARVPPLTPPVVTEPLTSDMPYNIKQEIKAVLQYMDQMLDALPQEKIEDFARSEHFETYKKLFEELGI